jgi:signal transduction histidine kinase
MNNREFRNIILIGSAVTILMAIGGFLFGTVAAGILSLITGGIILAVFYYYTKKRYKRIEQLNDYLVKVLSRDDTPDILDQEEGELSILANNIYKAASTLKYQNEILEDDKKQLASAIADISHQLKTPLTSMMVMNDLLAGEEDTEKRQEFLRTQSAQLSRMNWLIQTLLKLSKLDAGTIELKREQTSDTELIKEVIKPFEIQFELRGITYKQDISDIELVCDKNWTVEALQNIVKNCIEHMDEGGELEISTLDTTLFTQITIKDTGCGIAEEDIPHIFERFYKGKNAGKDSVGIGLALTKAIIEDQHGEITVKSIEGSGTTFVIKLYKTIV